MGDGDNGVTLKIDADTAAYIAKLAKLAEAHEKVTKHTEGWGSAISEAMGKATSLLGPVAALDAAWEAGKATIEGINRGIESASKTTDTWVDKLRRVTAITNEGRAQVEEQLKNAPGSLTADQRVAAFAAFREAAPGSVGTVSASAIGAAAAKADNAGYDTSRFMGVAGNLYGAFGAKSFDAASLFLEKTGNNADSASELARRFADKFGAGAAKDIAPYMLASAEGGDKKMSVLNEAFTSYKPIYGSLTDYISRKFQFDQSGQSSRINELLPQARADITAMGGKLNAREATALADAPVAERQETKAIVYDADVANQKTFGGLAEWRERRKAQEDLYRAEHPIKSVLFGVPESTLDGVFRGLLSDIRDNGTKKVLRGDVHREHGGGASW